MRRNEWAKGRRSRCGPVGLRMVAASLAGLAGCMTVRPEHGRSGDITAPTIATVGKATAPPALAEATDPSVRRTAAQLEIPEVGETPADSPRPPANPADPTGPTLPNLAPPPVGNQSDVPGSAPSVIPEGASYPIDLSTALRLAEVQNPAIAATRAEVLEALAAQTQARVLLLPSLNAGGNYHGHTGNLQRSSGRILNLSEQSLYLGAGARTLAAESVGIPGININTPLTEALLEPLVARQVVAGSQFQVRATANATLLEVADRYLTLIGAESILGFQRLSESQAADVVRITDDFARTGEGRISDAERAKADRLLRRAEVEAAEAEVAVSSARLAEVVNLDAGVRLKTLGMPLEPIELIDARRPNEELLSVALARRPEMGVRSAAINAAEVRKREEVVRPLLPTLWLGFSGGGFGGGSNLSPPLLGRFTGRSDFDVRATWTVLNFGAGNLSLIKRRQAQVGEAVAERSRTINLIREQVTSAKADALSRRGPIDLARRSIQSAELGYKEDLSRTKEARGRPIEVLNNLRLLAVARVNLVKATIEFNQAQFRLFVALGSPPPVGSSPGPVGPPPVGTPLNEPIVSCAGPCE